MDISIQNNTLLLLTIIAVLITIIIILSVYMMYYSSETAADIKDYSNDEIPDSTITIVKSLDWIVLGGIDYYRPTVTGYYTYLKNNKYHLITIADLIAKYNIAPEDEEMKKIQIFYDYLKMMDIEVPRWPSNDTFTKSASINSVSGLGYKTK